MGLFDVKKKNIIQKSGFYEASADDFYKVICEFDDDYKTVAVFSHNPGITAFANQLSDIHIDDMPTCSMFAVRVFISEWKDFKEGQKEFWFFDYPKNIS